MFKRCKRTSWQCKHASCNKGGGLALEAARGRICCIDPNNIAARHGASQGPCEEEEEEEEEEEFECPVSICGMFTQCS
jgi:hypothetical protein